MKNKLNFNSDAIQTEIAFPQGVSENQEKIEQAKKDLLMGLSLADTRQTQVDLNRLKDTPVVSKA